MLLEEYFDENIDSNLHKINNLDKDTMFDSQIKSILKDLNYQNSNINLEESITSLSIVAAAKKSMEEERTVELEEVKRA